MTSRARRPIAALDLADVQPNTVTSTGPIFEHVDPTMLLVDERYQRELSPKGKALIAKIVAGWDWRRFKPPVAVMVDAGLELIDGQHTAIAAATHPEIETIPVMIVEAVEISDRAAAFIGHNRDRIAVTPMELHHAAVTAGDEDALTIVQVCARAGVKILRKARQSNDYEPGETIAIRAISGIVGRQTAQRARLILEALARADLMPILTSHVRAAELLLTDDEFRSEIDSEGVTAAIVAAGGTYEQDARVFAKTHCIPIWRAIAITWFKARPKRRKPAVAEEVLS